MMVVYIAIDKDNGLLFNNRRQSQDRIMCENMLKNCGTSNLWIAPFSQSLFESQGGPLPSNLIVDEDFLDKAGENDHCFVENISLSDYIDKIDTLVIYKWNRKYPADFYFDWSILGDKFKKFSLNDFKGFSHENIKREVWKRI